MSGTDGIFANYLADRDRLRNAASAVFQLDGLIDLEAVKELFVAESEAGQKYRKFKIGNVHYMPAQFSCVLTTWGIEDAQIKGAMV
jgi:hypothetical protein